MIESTPASRCDCGILTQLAWEAAFPIRFDAELNEYLLSDREGRTEQLMRFCFWCGGSLPESRRDRLFCEISEREIQEVQRLLTGLTNSSEVVKLLGAPDNQVENPDLKSDGNPSEIHRWLCYRKQWTTLDLIISIHHDDRISFTLSAKPKPT